VTFIRTFIVLPYQKVIVKEVHIISIWEVKVIILILNGVVVSLRCAIPKLKVIVREGRAILR
jgi:hypothetical protein